MQTMLLESINCILSILQVEMIVPIDCSDHDAL